MAEQVDFSDWVVFHVEDPTLLTGRGYPTFVKDVCVFVNRPWHEIINDRRRPQSHQVDDATVHITTDFSEAWRISRGRPPYQRYVCAHCGGGLDLDFCHGCGARFRDNKLRTGINAPMPRKVALVLREGGHTFGQEPEIVWQRER